jgi:uncharacterized protein YndB with AHSA1/START domain
MANSTSGLGGPGLSLQIKRTFQAPREKVWAAWTERKGLEQWMCRDVPTHDPKYTELDVRPGGRYSIEIKQPDGVVYRGAGTFRAVKPPEKLVFTWAWTRVPESAKDRMQATDTVVTVQLFARGNATEMVFTHEGFATEATRESHNKGWTGCFEKLAEHLKVRA